MVHNEYLEALFEGGLPRLFLTVGLVLAMLISAGRALPRLRGRSAALMVLGTLFGLVALSVHSLVDFGIHLPGVALLAAVLLAHLSGWSASSNEIETRSTSGLLAIPILLLLGFLLATSGYDYFQAQEALRTSRLLAANVKEDTLDQRLKLLQTAVRLQPGDAEIHLVLGQTYLDASERFPPRTAEAESYLLAALREWREARNRSPVLPAPHARLGVYRDRFLQADSALNYFQRARTTAANDPNIWYVTGKFLFEAGEFERAWADWKRSLELGDDDFNAIITRAGKKLNSQQMVEQLLPANPDLLVRAAYLLHSRENESPPERRPYLLKAIELWKQTDSNASPDLVKLALLYREVGDFERAIPLLQKACDRDPTQITWRLQLAETYRDADRLKEAIEELQKLIREERGNKEIRDRLAVLRRELELRE
jgi:tetratricopeptide (TPR) repeat protein